MVQSFLTSPSSFLGKAYTTYRLHPRLTLLVLALVTLILLSSIHTPDPSSPSFQWPGLLPSRYPPSLHANNPVLNRRLAEGSELLHEVCHGHGPLEPVYIDPGLTLSQAKRYDHLRHPIHRSPSASSGSSRGEGGGGGDDTEKKIMVVSTLRQIHDQLPDFLNTLIVLVTFLGAPRLAFSFIEGPSDDCTTQAFEQVIGPTLLKMGVTPSDLHLVTGESKIDFGNHNRIEVLAELRNRALRPLWGGGSRSVKGQDVEAVVMLNDVFMRAKDVLELLHQHVRTGAGITTGWDWWQRRPAYYYDVWVGRTIDKGDLFYPIRGSSWSPSDDLFPDSPASKTGYDTLTPFQAYSSWNGIAVLDPRPFLPPNNVRFRKGDSAKGECTASECGIVAQDFWAKGFGRVQVVPSVQFAYETRAAQETRDDLEKAQRALGWVDGVPPDSKDSYVSWSSEPPSKVRCHPWPEKNGKDANVWENTIWVDPFTGMPVA